MSLKPTEKILKVDSVNIGWLSPEAITVDAVGHKGLGLACLPPAWTLPFLVISSELLDEYRQAKPAQRRSFVDTWSRRIQPAAVHPGIDPTSPILVRSSAVSESLEDRGRYFSAPGTLDNLGNALGACLQHLADDQDLSRSKIHLIVQREISPVSGKGHLSNERHCYEEARDWMGQFEGPDLSDNETFSINLRNWRRKETSRTETHPLTCNLKAFVSNILRAPAWWGYQQGVRLHFEWVWDGECLFIVQVDEAIRLQGVDPTADPDFTQRAVATYRPKVLSRINSKHAQKYNKIKNVYTYLKLRLPITELYVVDDKKVLEAVRREHPPQDLVRDLEAFTKGSLVIRTDLATSDTNKLQLLPRTNEVRNAQTALAFLKTKLNELHTNGVTDQVAFIFHNFIPAISSAFVYAAPGQRKVWIEALWGLPEGLYYNSHDKIEVDTLVPDITRATPERVKRFAITKRPHFKRYFVSPDSHGNWVMKTVTDPWDWRVSIPKDEWIRQIALDSRRIAEEEGRSISVMWFVGVPKWASSSPAFPWYHEAFDLAQVGRPQASRRKTPFDQSHIVRTRKDVELLQREALSETSRIRQIRIQPSEEPLLRDKDLLRKIGELAKKIDAVILLEGSTLSHAYYQLIQTKAIVEVVHPFDAPEDKREFNKLVRDDIPKHISKGGESVRVARLSGELLLRALREKLVEESFEALDATSQHSIVEELADVQEVIGAVLKQLGVTHRDLAHRQKAKRSKSGGFEKGYILVNTNNPAPDREVKGSATLPLSLGDGGGNPEKRIVEQGSAQTNTPIRARWGDKREHRSASEQLIKLVVTLVGDKWSAESTEIPLGPSENDVIRARIQGRRSGANLHLEISVYIPPRQLKLIK